MTHKLSHFAFDRAVLTIVLWGFSYATWSAPLAFVANKSGAFPGGSVDAYITAIASARLTRPGVDDIVVARGVFPPTPATNIPLRLLAPQLDGSVADVTTATFGSNPPARVHPREITFGDINRDGHLDIFIAAHGYDQPPFTGETNALLLSQPAGSYADASALLPTTPDFSHSAVIGDINDDSNPDICVVNIYGQLSIGPYCLLGNGGTAFTAGGQLPSYVTSLTQKYTTSLMLDINNDGYPDLVLGADANNRSVILFDDGTGDFTQRASWTLPLGRFGDTTINLSIAVIDINADGFPDLLFSQTSLNYVGHAIQVLINDGHGAFEDQTDIFLPSAIDPTGAWFEFVRVLDINGDGIPDIYAQGVSGIAPTSDPIVFAWVSDATGHYVSVDSSVIGGHFPFMVVFTDQDGDGLPDLISLSNGPLGQINYQTFRNVTPKPLARELAFAPVTPCRLADTRNAVGPFLPRAGRAYAASDATRIGAAGGNPAGCGIPVGPSALALTLTAVAPAQVGNLVAYPAGEAQPLSSALNFLAGQIVANTTIVPITPGAADNFTLFNNSDGNTPVVVDVVGYFWKNQAADCTRVSQSQPIGAGGSAAIQAVCNAGFVPQSGGCSTDTANAITWVDRRNTVNGLGYSCGAFNSSAGSIMVTTDAWCCRKAGR